LLAACAVALPAVAHAQGASASGNPAALQGNGMWIWVMGASHRGSIPAIVAQARRSNIRTLFIKSGDGRNYWRQFTPALVSALHRAGLRVCAWQYVYGSYPVIEAQVGAQAVRSGADCLVIDAESEYEGRYVSAYSYLSTLRRLVGATYPISLAAFPYVHFHPGFPYSVFLGPGGAQFNQPQMYWRTIGTTVDQSFVTTYTHNRVYKRPIAPLGQTYAGAPPAEVQRFRQVAQAYRAQGVSWWSWQATPPASFAALGRPVPPLTGYQPRIDYPVLRVGSRGDRVVWAQQHLFGAGQRQPITGYFGNVTASSVRAFQAARGLAQTGVIDGATWPALLSVGPVSVRWQVKRTGTRVEVVAVPARAGARQATIAAPAPASASLPAIRREIPAKR
jgi:Putative peptidoglycan binding domain